MQREAVVPRDGSCERVAREIASDVQNFRSEDNIRAARGDSLIRGCAA